jgi:hypothetical protein
MIPTERRVYDYMVSQSRPLHEFPRDLRRLIRKHHPRASPDERFLLWEEDNGSVTVYRFPRE